MDRMNQGVCAFRERIASRVLLGLSALLFVVLRIPCTTIPLERDEGAYAYVAQQSLEGSVPYRDVFDHKPPGVYLAYLVPIAVAGRSVAAIHVTAYLATVVSALFLFLAARKLAGPLAASCTALVFAVLTIGPSWQATAANTEHFMLVPMTASFWCLLKAEESDRGRWWVTAGALAAAACWVKPVALTHAVFLAILAVVRGMRWTPRQPARRLARAGLWAFTGGLVVTLVGAASLGAMGAWSDFLDSVVSYNAAYVREVPFSVGWRLLRAELLGQAPALWAIVVAAAAAMLDFRRGRRAGAALLLGAFASSAAGLSVGGRFAPHYFLQAAPALAAAAGLAMSRAILALGAPLRGGLFVSVAAFVALGVVGPGLIHDARFFFRDTPEEKVRSLYGTNPFDVSGAIAARVRATTQPNDTVLIYGSEAEILFLAGRRSATRYIVFYPLTSAGPRALLRQREAWEEIEKSRPRVVLVTNVRTSLRESAASPSLLRENLAQMLGAGWTLDGVRVFDRESGRLVFGPEARGIVQRVFQASAGPELDMYLLVRP